MKYWLYLDMNLVSSIQLYINYRLFGEEWGGGCSREGRWLGDGGGVSCLYYFFISTSM
jgi:hypothetical protein